MFFPAMMAGGLGIIALRLALGAVFIVHGLPKLQKPEGMAASMKWSKSSVQLLGLAELLGGLSVITGIGMYYGALVLAAIMVGALYYKTQKWHVPFTAMDKIGWEFDLILLAGALAVMSSVGGFGGYGWMYGMMGRWY